MLLNAKDLAQQTLKEEQILTETSDALASAFIDNQIIETIKETLEFC